MPVSAVTKMPNILSAMICAGLLSVVLFLPIANRANADETYTLMTGEVPPFTSQNMKARGLVLEVIEETFRRANIKLKVEFHPWVNSQKKVIVADPGERLLAAPLTRSFRREPLYDWIMPIYDYNLEIVTNDPSLDLADMAALKTLPVCVLRESPAEYKVKQLKFGNVDAMISEVTCMSFLNDRRDKAVLVHGKMMAEHNYRKVGGNPAELRYGAPLEQGTIHMGATKGAVSDADKAALNKAMESIKSDGTFAAIETKYESVD